jgi:2-methylcitrate dehydratase PrpD
MWATRLGAYAVELSTADLSSDVRHAAKRCILDWLSATIPGGAEDPARFVAASLAEEVGSGSARLIPDGTLATARTAALINGTAAHTLEVDDIYRDAIYHPGPPVIAAALAAAQSRRLSGNDLIVAIVAGYEISNRIGRAIQPKHYDYWHTTGTVGAFGAAAASAKALNLNARQAKHAIANAATFAAALQQAFRSDAMSKALHAGRAAETGLLCALMAEHGVTGADNMLEGERGFGNAMSEDVDWAASFADIGEAYTITRMTQKNHCCCGHTFAAIDGVLEICSTHDLSAEDIKRISVGTYKKALEVCGNRDPQTPYEAKFSLSYVCAMAALQGSVRLAAFTPDWLKNADLRALMDRIDMRVDPRTEEVFPGHRSAYVEIETQDGKTIQHHAPTRKGDPDAPLSDTELEDKFRELAGTVLEETQLTQLIERVWKIDNLDDVNGLI